MADGKSTCTDLIQRSKKAVTVTGEISSEKLGLTLPHEHVFLDSRFMCREVSDLADHPMSFVKREDVLRNPVAIRDNLHLSDVALAESELRSFIDAGGKTLVELTIQGLKPNPSRLRQLAQRTGLQIIHGCGYYVQEMHPPEVQEKSIAELAAVIISQIKHGVGADGVRSGVIGEIGTSDPLGEQEERVLRAAAMAHKETGAPINIHFASGCREVFRVLDVLSEAGVDDLGKVICSHMDVVLDGQQQKAVALRGAVVEFDTFGNEGFHDSHGNMMPSDEERIEAIKCLLEHGLRDHVLISHDICWKMNLSRYGGQGYGHILNTVLPKMRARGVSESDIHHITVVNPARLFAFVN